MQLCWAMLNGEANQIASRNNIAQMDAFQYHPILLNTTLGRVSTDTIGRRSADTRPTSRPTLGRDIDRQLVERRSTCSSSWQTVSRHYRSILNRYVGLHLPDTLTVTLQWTFGGISVDCRWYIGRHLVVYCVLLTVCFAEIFWNVTLLLPLTHRVRKRTVYFACAHVGMERTLPIIAQTAVISNAI